FVAATIWISPLLVFFLFPEGDGKGEGRASCTLSFGNFACLTGDLSGRGPVMTRALLYQSQHKWRLGVALGAATVIHLAALRFANNHSPTPAGPPNVSGEPTEVTLEPAERIPDPPTDLSDPLPTPPPTEQS